MKSFLVIGLGRFGASVAQELSALGQEVLALDIDAENVQYISDQVTQAIQGDAQDEAVLRSVGARNFDCCVVAVGADMEASILITVMLKELGAQYIVAKAIAPIHARVLERVGADRVVLPEIEMGQRLAQRLARTNVVDYIGVSDDFSILETTLDLNQWFAFKPVLPVDRLSNINYGQRNDDDSPTKILALKGIGNGFSNILYFRRKAGEWELYKFEDTSI